MPQMKPRPPCDSVSRHYPLARLKAIASEQRASAATDPALRQDWEELAIEWHLLASLSAAASAPAAAPAKDPTQVVSYIENLSGAMHGVIGNN